MSNPFIRGYKGLHIRKEVVLTHEEDKQLNYCQLVPEQDALEDDLVVGATCIRNDTYAYICEPGEATPDLHDLYPLEAQIRGIVYAVRAVQDGKEIMLGDVESRPRAEALIQRIQFETGFYSQAFEISSTHIPEEEWDELLALVTDPGTDFPGCETFTLPNSDAVGFKLHTTPWTEEHLNKCLGYGLSALQAQQHDDGLPSELIRVLTLAGQADVRLLILDPNATVVHGLKQFD